MRTPCSVILVVALAASASCRKSSPTDSSPTTPSTPASIVGTWRATRAEYYSRQNSSLRVDGIAQGQGIGVVFESTTCSWNFDFPGVPTTIRTGNWRFETIDREQNVRVTWTSGGSGDSLYRYSLSGNTLTLTHASGEYYDYTGNGFSADDDSGVILTLARQAS
jgi:hypothetical protein